MREKLAKISLLAGMFFLPLGFDVAFKYILDLTGSFLCATLTFYCVSLSFFISSLFVHKKLRDVFLALGMFFLPFGFDFLLWHTVHLVGSYWKAIRIFYVISAGFFTTYFVLARRNPMKILREYVKRIHTFVFAKN